MDRTILIVDDSPTFVSELRAVFERQGYEVIAVARGEEGLDVLRTTSVDLLIVEAMLPGMDGFEFVRQVRLVDAWGAVPIIMVSVRSSPEDYAEGFQAGANEYFAKPVDPPKLLAVATAQIARRVSPQPVRTPIVTVPEPVVRRPEKQDIITVFSLKGGVGTSTIAVNLAVAIKQLVPSSRVGLIDLSLEQGIDALMLDVVPTSTILDWARADPGEATPSLLHQYFVPHRSGISLLAAPPSPEDAEIVRPDVVRRILDLAQKTFDYLVVDTASTFNEATLIALESATTIVLPMTPDMAALKTVVNTIRILTAMRIDQEKFRVVLNEIVPRAGLTKDQIEGSLRHNTFVIPHAGPALIEASNHGTPLTSEYPGPPAGRALFDLAATLCEPEEAPKKLQAKSGGGQGLRTVVDRLRPRRT